VGGDVAEEWDDRGRPGCRLGPVYAAGALRTTALEVDDHVAVGDADGDRDRDVDRRHAVGVHPTERGVGAVRYCPQLRGHAAVRIGDEFIDVRDDRRGGVLLTQLDQSLTAALYRTELGHQVALEQVPVADIRQVKLHHVGAGDAPRDESNWGY